MWGGTGGWLGLGEDVTKVEIGLLMSDTVEVDGLLGTVGGVLEPGVGVNAHSRPH